MNLNEFLLLIYPGSYFLYIKAQSFLREEG